MRKINNLGRGWSNRVKEKMANKLPEPFQFLISVFAMTVMFILVVLIGAWDVVGGLIWKRRNVNSAGRN